MYMPGDVIHVIRVGEWSNYNSLPFLPDGSLPSYFPTNNMSSHQHTDPTNTFTNSEKELEEQCAKVFGELGQQNSIPYCTHVLDAAGGEGSRGGGSTTTTISATPFFSDKDCIADVICSKAAELHAAAIIVTSRTRSTIARLTQGSVADRCIHHCSQPGGGSRSGHGGGDEEGGESIPVILLNPPLSTPDNNNNNKSDITSTSLPPLIKKKSRKTVIVAVDDNAVSQRAVKWAANHLVDKTKNNDTFLRLIHITQSPSLSPFLLHPLDSAPSFLPVELNLTEDEVREAAQQALTPLFQPILQGGGERKEDGLQWKLDVVMVALGDGVGGVGGALCAAAEEELKKKKKEEGGIGVEVVLVVGSEAHGGLSEFLLGSVATYVEHHASVPLVVVH
jgi:nucleotide-binding universal stress UspA family protein